MAVRLARGEGLPVQRPGEETPWRQEGSQPPLYYALLAGITHALRLPLDDLEALIHRNPHAYPGDASQVANRNQVLHGPWEHFPWRGAVLTLHLWRLASVLLGLLTVLATVETARLFFPDRPRWALGSGLLVAANPMFLFITASVNNDALVNAMTAVGLWLLALHFRRGRSWVRTVLLGLALGAAALAKLSGLALWPPALALLLIVARRERQWRHGVLEATAVFTIALALCGGWFWRNWTLYRDPLGLSVMLDIVGRRSATLTDLVREFEGFRWSFWGVFGCMNVLMPLWVYRLLDLWTVLWAAGLLAGVGWSAGRSARACRWGERWLVGLWLLAYVAGLFIAFLRWTSQTMASQGRLLFPAIGPISLGLWAGWETVVSAIGGSHRLVRLLRALPILLLAALAFLSPFLWIAPAYQPPEWPEKAEIPHRLEAVFGGEFRLLGYALSPSSLRPGQSVDLTLYGVGPGDVPGAGPALDRSLPSEGAGDGRRPGPPLPEDGLLRPAHGGADAGLRSGAESPGGFRRLRRLGPPSPPGPLPEPARLSIWEVRGTGRIRDGTPAGASGGDGGADVILAVSLSDAP